MVKAIMDRVFIRLDKKTAGDGGILLPETVVNERTTGIVESVGEEVTSVRPGDRVLFHIFDDLPTYDPEVVVVRESSLLGKFENE